MRGRLTWIVVSSDGYEVVGAEPSGVDPAAEVETRALPAPRRLHAKVSKRRRRQWIVRTGAVRDVQKAHVNSLHTRQVR